MAAGTEVDSAVGTSYAIVKVSPTVLSSDLFTPCQLTPRATLPSVGEFHHPICTSCGTWGCDITHYGGIGPYTFQGKQRIRRDLPVSRSHRHYGSGLGKSSTSPQPYRLTSLKLSGSRKNDEILPPPMRVTFPRSSTWQNEPWPGHHAYTSHRSKFEVFPRIDPQQTEYGGPVLPQSRTEQELGRATNIALGELTRKRYQSTQYREGFQGTSTPPPTFNQLLDQTKISDANYPASTTGITEHQESDELDSSEEEDVDDEEKENENDSGIGSENGSVTSLNVPSDSIGSGHSDNCPLHQPNLRRVTFCDKSKTVEDSTIVESSGEKQLETVTGIGPCWPPSTSYVIENINGTQLLERDDIQTYPPAYRSSLKPECTCKKTRLTSATGRSTTHSYGLKSSGSVFNHVLTTSKDQHKDQLNPITHRLIDYPTRPRSPLVKKDSKIVSSEVMLKKLGVANNPSKEDITIDKRPFVIPRSYSKAGNKENLPALKPTNSSLKVLTKPNWSSLPLPPAPLSDCLSASGNRVPHRLGLRFKTEAHHRFISLHPEPVPDLRDARNSGRRVIFFNYHSSAFRG
ncbi:uncharacterized protein [Antedon mediterranea]|uniref:uncharacterized protein n=1 Tax=Antedon mediterranea TaxID=105859 RepID=UPI003AF7D412